MRDLKKNSKMDEKGFKLNESVNQKLIQRRMTEPKSRRSTKKKREITIDKEKKGKLN